MSDFISSMFAAAREQAEAERPTPPTLDIEAIRLRDMERAFNRDIDILRPGDIVRYKRGLYVSRHQPTGLWVVLRTIPDRQECTDTSDMSSFGIRYDTQVGLYDDDGDFIIAWSDARRLELVPEELLTADRRHVDANPET